MAQGQKEIVSEGRRSGIYSAHPLQVTLALAWPWSGKSPREAAGSQRLKGGGLPAGLALASLPWQMNAAIHCVGSLWAFTSRSFQNNNNKNPIEAPFSSDHVFPEFFLEIGGCMVHTRPQEAGLFSPPYNSW